MITKIFWKTYINDKTYIGFKMAVLIACLTLISILIVLTKGSPANLLLFSIGYILSDPFAYYFLVYLPKQNK